MRKFLSIGMVIVLTLCLYTPCDACAKDLKNIKKDYSMNEVIELKDDDVIVSEPMNYSEVVDRCADINNISEDKMKKVLQKNVHDIDSVSNTGTYRELRVSLNVSASYKPQICFFCNTSEYGNYWGITDIFSIQLLRKYNGITKQFTGNIEGYLRSGAKILYIINGDFYNNGSTTNSAATTASANGVVASAGFSASISTTSNHYKYFYNTKEVLFQR